MLVLTRKTGQSILIGDSIEVVILEVRGNQVKVGISAPKHVKVLRKELYEQVQEQNIQAAESILSVEREKIGELAKMVKGVKFSGKGAEK